MGVQVSQPLSLERREWLSHKVSRMFSAERTQRLAPGVVLDIVAELNYWRSCYPYRHFYHSRLPFDSYVPTFKFGYDSYLLHHGDKLIDLSARLEIRYAEMHSLDRLVWKDAAAITAAAWQRMGGAVLP
jgi:hypothetical protein